MDPKNQADTSDMQAMFGADNSIVSWSPSGEFLGQDFNAATPFSPNEFLKFCNALSSEVEWPESKQGPTPEEGSKHPDPEDQAAGQPDPHTIEQTRGYEAMRARSSNLADFEQGVVAFKEGIGLLAPGNGRYPCLARRGLEVERIN